MRTTDLDGIAADPTAPRGAVAGFSAARLSRIDSLMQRYVDDGKIAGLVAKVARDGETALFSAYGLMDIEAGRPMATDAIFRIMSMTKPVTSVAVMMLYEEGGFHLNTPVHEFIPDFRDVRVYVEETPTGLRTQALETPITFRHLFTHTSGLSYGSFPEDPVDRLYQKARRDFKAEGIDPTLQDVVTLLTRLPLAFQPGTQWRYGFSIDVLGYLIELISGQTLDAFFRERIFQPLGMEDTGFWVERSKLPRLTALYGYRDGADALTLLEAPAESTLFDRPTFLSGGGGLVSTTGDYARFAQMLANYGELDGVRLLSPKTVELFTINQAPRQALPFGSLEHDAGYGYSLGTKVLLDVAASGQAGSVGEFGWSGAYSTYFWVDPVESVYGVLMTQLSPNNYFPIAKQFKQLTYQALVARPRASRIG